MLKLLYILSGFCAFTLYTLWLLNLLPHNSKVTELRIESENFATVIDHHSPLKNKLNKAIILIPPTGGMNILDKKYARAFTQKGFDTYIIKTWTGDDEVAFDKNLHNRFYGRGLQATTSVVEHIESSKSFSSIDLFGTSVGALHGEVAAHSLPQIKKFFAVSGGIDFAKIISTSDQEAMKNLKSKRIEIYEEFNEKNYYETLKPHIKFEPLNITFDRSSKTFGQVIIEDDSTVPTSTQLALKEFWSPQKVIFIKENILSKLIKYPHKAGVIWTSIFYEKEIVNFFTPK